MYQLTASVNVIFVLIILTLSINIQWYKFNEINQEVIKLPPLNKCRLGTFGNLLVW
jgi:hypothetical protein